MASIGKRGRLAMWILLAAVPWIDLCAVGQQASGDQSELTELKSELKRIAARIDALEAAQAAVQKPAIQASECSSVSASVPPVAPEAAQPQRNAAKEPEDVKEASEKGTDTMDVGMGGEQIKLPYIPQLKIRGFGDVRGFVANQNLAVIGNNPGAPTLATQGGNSTFALGLMDMFVTSRISDRFSYLAEVGFEADAASNGVSVDLERAQLSFTLNDKFSISAGRTHAMLGYYNTAFHHGTWFQTTIDRPRIFEFEDSGGPLPIHNVGVAMMGKIPSGKLGLHWLGEVGNGKQTYSLQATVTPANVLADHTGKSANLGVFVRPDKFSGLQAGFNWYQASLVPVVSKLPGFGAPGFPFPNAASYYRQNIFIGHVVYIQPRFEFMAEGVEIRDQPRGSNQPLYTSGGYAQVSKAYGVLRPYFRYQWLNPNFKDPTNAWVGRWVGPNAGIRWDLNTFIALKGEYSHFDWKNFSVDNSGDQVQPLVHKTIDQLGVQLTYTF
jgi:hypothetical protein